MAVLSVAAFISKWGTGKFPSDGLRNITGLIMREFRQDIADSFQSVLGTTAVTSWKDPCIVATTVNITLSGEQTIDGVLTSASRVLVKNQSDQEDNGIYVSDAGAWTRATDADSAAEVEGAAVGVTQGTVGQNSIWLQTSDNVTLGTTPLVWQQIGFGVSSQSLDEVLATGNDGGGLAIKNIDDPTDPQDAATKAYVDGIAADATWQSATISISSGEILALNGTPKLLVSSPGVGSGICVSHVILRKVASGVAYATNTTLRVYLGSTATPIITDVTDFLTQTNARVQLSTAISYGNTTVGTNHIYLTVMTGNPTAGNGAMNVDIVYKIVSV